MTKLTYCGMLALVLAAVATTQADPTYVCVGPNNPCYPKCGGPVNISGATLFDLFFRVPASTNDFIDADCDGIASPNIDQLAGAWNPSGAFWWIVQDRATGSGNGLAEFVNSHLDPNWVITPSAGYINRTPYAANTAGPLPPTIIHLAVMDVPTTWFITQTTGTPAWGNHPLQPGYGNNAVTSWDAGQSNKLKSLKAANGQSLNLNLSSPDNRTVYDTEVAWVPIAIVANQGTGLQDVKASDLQYLWTTGRMPNGENLVAATRDSGSGTRNAGMNSLAIDPSFGRGDNLGKKTDEYATTPDPLGPQHQDTNLGGTGRLLASAQNNRLSVGYAGIVGSGVNGAIAGKYEFLNVQFDIRGGTNYVRPSLSGILHNCNGEVNAWQIGGNETFASIGDPADIGYPMDPNEQAAKDYLNNIRESIAAFVTAPDDPNNNGSPGEFLATQFTLAGAIDCLPNTNHDWVANPNLNSTLQAWIENNTAINVPPFGGTPAGKIPVRAPLNTGGDPNSPQNWPHATCDCAYPPNGQYSDGSTTGAYRTPYDPNGTYAWIGGQNLNLRNHLSGDFNGDGLRNLDDIPYMIQAYYDRYVNNDCGYTTYLAPGVGSTPSDPVIPEIIGDFNGDGNFDCRDVRYFCDGLAIDPNTGRLDRGKAFKQVDDTWFALTGSNNFFNTTLKDCSGNTIPYVAGAAAADVAGNTVWPGAAPHGYDCVVDCDDVLAIVDNVGNWAYRGDAVRIDLSCDLNGDLAVSFLDVQSVLDWMGGGTCANVQPPLKAGDVNCDGVISFADINPFVLAIGSEAAYEAAYPSCRHLNADCSGDGAVSYADINPFVRLLGNPGLAE